MTYADKIRANYALTETWLADVPDHDLEHRYVRTMLTQLLQRHRVRDEHITPERVRMIAYREASAAQDTDADTDTRILCGAAHAVLAQLADKLHDVSPSVQPCSACTDS